MCPLLAKIVFLVVIMLFSLRLRYYILNYNQFNYSEAIP